MTLQIIIIKLLTIIVSSFLELGIDYNPRILRKELSTIFRDKPYEVSELQNSDQVNGKFFKIKCVTDEKIIAYIGRINSCRAGGCSNDAEAGIGLHSEYFDYFILFDTAKNVKLVRVFNYEATHGHEVTIKKWLDQFAGFDGEKPLRVGKEVDTISGATISVNAITTDIKEKTAMLKKQI